MIRHSICILCLTTTLAAGCRTQPYVNAHIETVNAEFRELEDYVYCLEEEKARLEQELAATRRGSTTAPSSSGSGGLFRRRPAGEGSSGELTPPRIEANPATDVPMIEIPGGGTPTPPPTNRSESQRPDASDESAVATASAKPDAIPARPADAKVTHVFLNPLLTGGADFDGQPGDEGLTVVLEPRNGQDEYVPQAGPVSVVVLDPTRQGDAARVARWDFDLSQARQMLATASPARGLKLELPWPAAPPANTHLKVFVRYETADGRKLQSDREIHLTPAGEMNPGWTPRPGAALAAAAVEQAASLPAPPVEPVASPPSEQSTASPLSPPAALSADTSAKPLRPAWSPNR